MNLQDQLDAAERRLRETAEGVVRLLVEHVAHYPEAEIRRRFLASDALDHVGDSALRLLRADAAQLGRATVARIEKELAWPGPWLLSVVELPAISRDNRQSLREFPLLWAPLASLDSELEALASRHGLAGDDRQPAGYQLPKMFVGGLYLPTETEKLLKAFGEIADLRGKLDNQTADGRRQTREKRWQDAG